MLLPALSLLVQIGSPKGIGVMGHRVSLIVGEKIEVQSVSGHLGDNTGPWGGVASGSLGGMGGMRTAGRRGLRRGAFRTRWGHTNTNH